MHQPHPPIGHHPPTSKVQHLASPRHCLGTEGKSQVYQFYVPAILWMVAVDGLLSFIPPLFAVFHSYLRLTNGAGIPPSTVCKVHVRSVF